MAVGAGGWGHRNQRRLSLLAAAAVVAISMTGCGSSRSIDEIAAAAGADPVPGRGASAAGVPGMTGVGSGTIDPTTGQPNAPATGGGSVAGGSTTPGSSQAGEDDPGAPGTPSGPASGVPIKLGNVGDYNGIVGAILGQAPLTLQVWASWLNQQGGLNGRPVEIISANTGSDPARQASIVRDMVENQGVVAFVSNMDALSGSGALSYLEQRQVPVIGGDGVTERWNQSPMLFPVTTGLRPLIAAIVDVAVRAGKPRIAFLYCAEADFICGLANRLLTQEGVARQRGAEIVYTAQVSIAQPGFTAECLQAQRAGAETVMAFVDANSLNRMSRDCRQQGFRPQYATGSLGVNPVLSGNPDLVGLRAPVTTFPWMAQDVAPAVAYHDALRTYAPDAVPSPDGAIAWTSAELFARAARAAGPEVTPATLIQALGGISNETLGGASIPLSFAAGQPTPPSTCYFVVEMSTELIWSAPQGSRPECL